jgi:hypothetical protein
MFSKPAFCLIHGLGAYRAAAVDRRYKQCLLGKRWIVRKNIGLCACVGISAMKKGIGQIGTGKRAIAISILVPVSVFSTVIFQKQIPLVGLKLENLTFTVGAHHFFSLVFSILSVPPVMVNASIF